MSDPKYKDVGTPVQRLVEECGELLQAVMKAERFGWFNHHPDRPERTNFDEVMLEMNDLTEAYQRLQFAIIRIENAKLEKGGID
ncbi:MAG: hypothetical protein Q8O19_00170 [Rectinemataceae bacterium]|nr:hypothetical protein [Rectinemataceae bacterium]